MLIWICPNRPTARVVLVTGQLFLHVKKKRFDIYLEHRTSQHKLKMLLVFSAATLYGRVLLRPSYNVLRKLPGREYMNTCTCIFNSIVHGKSLICKKNFPVTLQFIHVKVQKWPLTLIINFSITKRPHRRVDPHLYTNSTA